MEPEPTIDWTEEQYFDRRMRRQSQRETGKVEPLIDAWNGDSVGWLIPGLDALWSYERELGGAWSTECALQIRQALRKLEHRADLRWPEPWREIRCPFAFAVDRNGGFLRRQFRHTGRWEVGTWAAGLNRRFDEQHDSADYDQHWSHEDERLLDIDLDLQDLDCMPRIFGKWGGKDVGRIAHAIRAVQRSATPLNCSRFSTPARAAR